MSAAAPWSVKGIDPKAREVAKDLARRSGMTLGEWLNTMIMEDGEDDDGYVPLSRRPHAADSVDRRGRVRRLDDAYERSGYDPGHETLQRVAASVDAIAARLEAAERRSTVAIQGVDQAVSGLVRRLDGQDEQARVHNRRIDDISEELKEGHRRLRAFEREVGPDTKSTFEKVEAGLGAVAARLYDIEERQRSGVNELRARMDAVEKTAGPGVGSDLMAQVSARLDQAQSRTTEALRGLERSFAGLDQRLRAAEGRVEPEGSREAARFEKLAETLARQVEGNRAEMMRRLDTAEHEGRMGRLEGAVQALGDTVKASEQRSARGIEAMGREVLRIAQNLSGRLQQTEARGQTQGQTLDAAIARMEARVAEGEGAAADKLSKVGQTLAADLTASLNEKLDRDMGRYAQAVEHRLTRSDDQHALALEKLGGEITRISDRLADRIAQSERKSAQALEDIGRRLSDSSDRIEQRYDRASGELAERMRMSEERTARLLSEAREALADRGERAEKRPEPIAQFAQAEDLRQPDWRAAAFGDEFEAQDNGWSADPLGAGPEPAPFPSAFGGRQDAPAEPAASAPLQPVEQPFATQAFAAPAAPRLYDDAEIAVETPAFETAALEPQAFAAPEIPAPEIAPEPEPQPFGGFGGADVEDALEATAPRATVFGSTEAASAYDAGGDEFAAETDFVDARSMRAGLAAGAATARASSTRSALDAARAAMVTPEAEEAPRQGGFGLGLKRGGKSRLQERLDKQAAKAGAGSTVRKAFLASVTGMAVVAGGFATMRLTGAEPFSASGVDTLKQALGLGPAVGPASATPTADAMLAVALTPTEATPAETTEAQGLFDRAVEQIDTGQSGGIQTLTRAANLGLPAAQLKLADLYERGENGVTRNVNEARLWARRAAEGGDPRGMHAYGMYLFDGVGGARNRPEALNWLVKAADRGLIDSQYNVARIYENGDDGIAPNPTEAFKWYLIAARTGDADAQGAVERLTPQVSAAGRRTARAAAEAFQTEPLA